MNTAVGTSVDMAETGTPLRLLSLRAAGALFGAAQLGCEYQAAFKHEHGRDGFMPDGGNRTTSEVFEAYVEQVLAPSLRPGRVMVMDKLSAHKGGKVRDLIEKRGCQLMYSPPYCANLNLIDEAFSKIKYTMRKARACTR